MVIFNLSTNVALAAGDSLRPQVEQVASNMGVQTLVSPAMCGDIGVSAEVSCTEISHPWLRILGPGVNS